ncbi:MAG: VOC family protein [Anaerolineae bacterium]
MIDQIFVNLPIKSLKRSVDFFTALGFTFNAQFTDETTTCMIVSNSIYVMLLEEERFRTFTPKPISDAHSSTEVLLAFACDSRATVDDLVQKAVAAGGSTYKEPDDHGFMYAHSFQDPDGHIWEVFYMDPDYVQPV